jgi:hypothetical protein
VRVSSDDLDDFRRAPRDAPAPIEPRLTVDEEVAMLSGKTPADGTLTRRQQRVLALMRTPAVPAPHDAELLVALASVRHLPIASRDDRLSAKTRLADIGRMSPLPPRVAATMRDLGIEPGDGRGLADRLLPPAHDLSKLSDTNPTTGWTYG